MEAAVTPCCFDHQAFLDGVTSTIGATSLLTVRNQLLCSDIQCLTNFCNRTVLAGAQLTVIDNYDRVDKLVVSDEVC